MTDMTKLADAIEAVKLLQDFSKETKTTLNGVDTNVAVAIDSLLAEVIALRAEVERLTKGSICEVAASNASIMEYMRHWEARATAAEADAERLAAQLDIDRRLVSEAAMTGFRWEDGDWAERLFENNGQITAALAAHTQRVNAKEGV